MRGKGSCEVVPFLEQFSDIFWDPKLLQMLSNTCYFLDPILDQKPVPPNPKRPQSASLELHDEAGVLADPQTTTSPTF